ncbi:hypothetical protein CVS40_6578 [Lucilia cuprina]|nr:hypothetical protein CVS40_6578 [Lucilia cuprina]
MSLKIFVFLILLSLLLKSQCAKRRFDLEFYNFTCQAFGKRLKQIDCSFTKFSNEHYSFTEAATFDRDMGKGLKLRLWIDVKQRLLKKYFRFVDVKLEACDALTHTFEQQFLKMIVMEYKRTTNLPTQCPFKGNHQYKMDNFSIKTENFPAYMPECNFTFGYDLYEINTLFATSRIMGSIVNK